MSQPSKDFKFYLVEFPKDRKSLSVVPVCWVTVLSEMKCLVKWPPSINEGEIEILAKQQATPEKSWKQYSGIIKYQSRSYHKADSKLEYYLQFSDLEYSSTDGEKSADGRIATNHVSSESSCSNCALVKDTLLHLMDEVKQVSGAIVKLNNQVCHNTELLCGMTSESRESVPIIEYLPVKTLADLNLANEKLLSNEEFAKVVKSLGIFGGRDRRDATRRVLGNLLSNDLAKQLNWKGSQMRKSIQEYPRIVELVAVSVRQNLKFDGAPLLEVEEDIKRWLRSAIDRDGGRNKRRSNIKDCSEEC